MAIKVKTGWGKIFLAKEMFYRLGSRAGVNMTTKRQFLDKLNRLPCYMVTGQPLRQDHVILYCNASRVKAALKSMENCGSTIIGIAIHSNDLPPPASPETFGHKLMAIEELAEFPNAKIVCFAGAKPKAIVVSSMRIRLAEAGIVDIINYHSPVCEQQRYMKFPETYLNENIKSLIAVYDSLNDLSSKLSYLWFLKARLTGDLGYIQRTPGSKTYHHPKAPVLPGDCLIDAGVSGNIASTLDFAKRVTGCGRIFSFEPEINCYNQAKSKLESLKLPQVCLLNVGLWSSKTEMLISNKGHGSSLVVGEKEGGNIAPLMPLDDFVLENKIDRVDVLKFDIEGAEMDALYGSRRTITKFLPKMIISLYHLPDDIFAVPLFIKSLGLGYKLYITKETWGRFDLILYAAPPKSIRKKLFSLIRLSKNQSLVFLLITPVVKKLANEANFQRFKENPAAFFQSLKSRKYRIFGRIFFPPPHA